MFNVDKMPIKIGEWAAIVGEPMAYQVVGYRPDPVGRCVLALLRTRWGLIYVRAVLIRRAAPHAA
jgi:hypothetical protein